MHSRLDSPQSSVGLIPSLRWIRSVRPAESGVEASNKAGQVMCWPAVTWISWPVMLRDRDEARNSTASAMSSGSTWRR